MPQSNRVALVTGAARGLARGVALGLADAGYRVAFTYRPGGTPPDETERLLRARGCEPFSTASDAAVAGETERAVHAVEVRLGRIDAFVHAAGPLVVKPFARCTFADYKAMIDANLGAGVEGALAVLPGMRERGFGRLAYFGMNGSHATLPAPGMALYGAAKAALVTFARALALEEARYGVTVNVIEPGDIRKKSLDRAAARETSAANPTGRAGSWEDIAYAVRFFVAEEASFINGAVLGVNGGLVMPYDSPIREDA